MRADVVIGMFPMSASAPYGGLWDALRRAFGVRFVDGEAPHDRLDGAILFGTRHSMPPVPTLTLPALEDAAAAVATMHRPISDRVQFGAGPWVDPRLRGRSMVHDGAGRLNPIEVDGRFDVLARNERGAVWVTDGHRSVSAVTVPELRIGERLKDHLRGGRLLGLVPIVELLRSVTGYATWQRPEVRATITFDDPSLRGRSYGFLNFRELATQASEHGYHAGIAMIPIGAHACRATAAQFRASPHLSLVVHGNDHLRTELLQSEPQRAFAIAAQARRRIAAFEARYGLTVEPVMVPPHSACSAIMMVALRRAGFEAVSYTGLAGADAVDGWGPADLHVAGGVTGLRRVQLNCGTDELALRTYLDQPLCLFGHHGDVAVGLETLAAAAERVGSIGSPTWYSLAEISRRNWWSRRDGTTLVVRLHTMRANIDLPEGLDHVVVVQADGRSDTFAVCPDDRRLEIHSSSPEQIPTGHLELRSLNPWPIIRRAVVEGRDRSLPILRRVRPLLHA